MWIRPGAWAVLPAAVVVAAVIVARELISIPPTPPAPSDMSILDPATADLVTRTIAEVQSMPEDPEAWRKLALVYMANELWQLAVPCFRQSIQIRPGDARTWYQLALTFSLLHENAAAIEAGTRAAELATRDAPPHWRLGVWLLDDGRLDEAHAAFERALAIDPDDAVGSIGLALVFQERGQLERAIDPLKHVVARKDGKNADYARYMLARIWRQLGRSEAAVSLRAPESTAALYLGDSWQLEPVQHLVSFGGILQLADQLNDAGRFDEAEMLLERLRERQPEHAPVLRKLAVVSGRKGDLPRSISLLTRSLELDADDDAAHFNLATSLARLAHGTETSQRLPLLEQALVHVDRSLQINPSYARAHALRGDLLLLTGEPDRALDSWTRAIELDSRNPLWQVQTGKLQTQLRRWDDASATLVRVTQEFPDQAEAWLLLGVTRINQGRLDDAEAALRQAARLRPSDHHVGAVMRQLASLRAGTNAPASGAEP